MKVLSDGKVHRGRRKLKHHGNQGKLLFHYQIKKKLIKKFHSLPNKSPQLR